MQPTRSRAQLCANVQRMSRPAGIAFLVPWLTLCAATAAALPNDGLVEAGLKRFEAGDAQAAIALWEQAIRQAPRDPRPHYLLGSAHAQAHHNELALRAYRAALSLDPKLGKVHNELGTLLLETQHPEEALAEFRIATAAEPGLVEAWINLGLMERDRKQYDAAITALGRAASIDPKSSTIVAVAAVQRQKGALSAAEATLRTAIAKNPRSLALQLEFARTLAAAHRCQEAFGVLSRLPNPSEVSATGKAVQKICLE